ncbi:hypothetical protein GALMADRAFT_229885 [Galerina marginata CBS 339.88]|uniref:Uncharacterized protein n=1 Tax=Galerina marginata (strain CBS 339.88) TaxID=685588 RepID=A0A067SJ16_GALM3|nr:hypothetical protein GALMADRAFT_229885 [Galerina marginata CBS 339.88]
MLAGFRLFSSSSYRTAVLEPGFEGGGDEDDVGAVELEKKQNEKRRRRLPEEDENLEEDGVDDFRERQGSENFSVEKCPRS